MRRNYERRIGELERKKISVHIPQQQTDGEQVQFEQRVTIEESRNEIKALTVSFLCVCVRTLVIGLVAIVSQLPNGLLFCFGSFVRTTTPARKFPVETPRTEFGESNKASAFSHVCTSICGVEARQEVCVSTNSPFTRNRLTNTYDVSAKHRTRHYHSPGRASGFSPKRTSD